MIIKNMHKLTKPGKLRAFFDVEWPDKMEICGMKLMQGDDGSLWAATPSREYEKDGQKKWAPIVRIIDPAIRSRISELARQEYQGPEDQEPEQDIPF